MFRGPPMRSGLHRPSTSMDTNTCSSLRTTYKSRISFFGGIGIAVSDRPKGPFVDALGKPLIGAFHNGAQPIDPMVYNDNDGSIYFYYGGQGHCNVARLAPDLKSVIPMKDGSL
jgi:hypothetical protein